MRLRQKIRIINCSFGSNVIHVDRMGLGLSDGQNQGICLRKDLIFDLPWDLEPFTTVFDNSVVYRDSASAADEEHSRSRGFETVLDVLLIDFYARKGEQRSISFMYVETSISG